jgi:hypothetical protein
MESNLAVRSNLMLDDEAHSPQHRYIPGDYMRAIYPELTDVRLYETALTRTQIIEMKQYLVCLRCRRPCAGMCS